LLKKRMDRTTDTAQAAAEPDVARRRSAVSLRLNTQEEGLRPCGWTNARFRL
jgi:hypothetical protein